MFYNGIADARAIAGTKKKAHAYDFHALVNIHFNVVEHVFWCKQLCFTV